MTRDTHTHITNHRSAERESLAMPPAPLEELRVPVREEPSVIPDRNERKRIEAHYDALREKYLRVLAAKAGLGGASTVQHEYGGAVGDAVRTHSNHVAKRHSVGRFDEGRSLEVFEETDLESFTFIVRMPNGMAEEQGRISRADLENMAQQRQCTAGAFDLQARSTYDAAPRDEARLQGMTDKELYDAFMKYLPPVESKKRHYLLAFQAVQVEGSEHATKHLLSELSRRLDHKLRPTNEGRLDRAREYLKIAYDFAIETNANVLTLPGLLAGRLWSEFTRNPDIEQTVSSILRLHDKHASWAFTTARKAELCLRFMERERELQ